MVGILASRKTRDARRELANIKKDLFGRCLKELKKLSKRNGVQTIIQDAQKDTSNIYKYASLLDENNNMHKFQEAIKLQSQSRGTKPTGLFCRLIFPIRGELGDKDSDTKILKSKIEAFLWATSNKDKDVIKEPEVNEGDNNHKRTSNFSIIEKLNSSRLSNVLKVFMALVAWDYIIIKRKAAEEEQARRAAKEEQARRAAEEEQARRAAEEEQARRAAEEEQARRAAEEEQARRAAEEEQARRTAEEQADTTNEGAKRKVTEGANRKVKLEERITKEQAREILVKKGYKILGDLGEGAASYVFKASRVNKNGGEEIIAAKVCCPKRNSWASLEDELRVAKELEGVKNKYLTIPTLKLHSQEKMDNEANYDVAILEAPLADGDMRSYRVTSGDVEYTIESKPDPDDPDDPEYSMDVVRVAVDYSALKRAIKGILKGLKAVHDRGMVHGDIKVQNVLKKFDSDKKKFRYSITDFGTLKSGSPKQQFEMDIQPACRMFLCFWLMSLGLSQRHLVDVVHNLRDFDVGRRCDGFVKRGSVDIWIPDQRRGPSKSTSATYSLTGEDKRFLEFDKKLYQGDFKSAGAALEDPWLKPKTK